MIPFEMPDVDFERHWLAAEKLQAGDSINSCAKYFDQVKEYLARGDELYGDVLPWSKVSNKIRVGRGQLSVWGGRNASGKSVLVGQVILNLLTKGRRSVIASFEMTPAETISRMLRQSAGCFPSNDWITKFSVGNADKLFIYDEMNRINPNKVLGMVHYAMGEMDIDHVVIDSLTKCGFTKDDYNSQAKFVDHLQQIAKSYGKHIHLIAHSRKLNHDQMGRDDIRGAAEITDLADNVFILTRNHRKEEEEVKKENQQGANEEILQQADAYLRIAKNRHFGSEGVFGLWFDSKSQQFVTDSSRRAMPYEMEDIYGQNRKIA